MTEECQIPETIPYGTFLSACKARCTCAETTWENCVACAIFHDVAFPLIYPKMSADFAAMMGGGE